MDELKELLSLCKCEVSIVVNEHRNYYQTIEQYFDEIFCAKGDTPEKDRLKPGVYEKMLELDTVIAIQAYKDTPIGFFVVYHYDIDLAIKKMIEVLKA